MGSSYWVLNFVAFRPHKVVESRVGPINLVRLVLDLAFNPVRAQAGVIGRVTRYCTGQLGLADSWGYIPSCFHPCLGFR